MPVHSQTMAQRPRVCVKVNNRTFEWFDHITRCEAALPICREQRPSAVELFPDHLVRCHLYPAEEVHFPVTIILPETPGVATPEPGRRVSMTKRMPRRPD